MCILASSTLQVMNGVACPPIGQSSLGVSGSQLDHPPCFRRFLFMYQTQATPQARSRGVTESMCSAGDWVSLQLRREAIERHVARGSRVLETNAGAGHFTEALHHLDCRVSVVDESSEELASTRASSMARGFGTSIDSWHHMGIVALEGIADGTFDAVVAYGGALSYALHRRDQALAEFRRVLRSSGVLAVDVLSLWGTLHRQLPLVVTRDLVHNRAVIRSGDVLGASRKCHLFRAAELRSFLCGGGFEVLSLSASSVLSTGMEIPVSSDASIWSALLEYERAACSEPGFLDGGSRLIAMARRR
jgi:SAM-dependent methyltransferase